VFVDHNQLRVKSSFIIGEHEKRPELAAVKRATFDEQIEFENNHMIYVVYEDDKTQYISFRFCVSSTGWHARLKRLTLTVFPYYARSVKKRKEQN
jgi:hypothetical protein